MRIVSRVAALATLGVSVLAAAVALLGLGSDRWISGGYASAGARAEVWGGALKTAAATEAEWLSARGATSLQTAAVLGTTRIDLGPLDVIDVQPLPKGLDLGNGSLALGSGEAGATKLLVSAREPGSGRTIHFIVDAAGSPRVAPRAAKHDGL